MPSATQNNYAEFLVTSLSEHIISRQINPYLYYTPNGSNENCRAHSSNIIHTLDSDLLHTKRFMTQ